MKEILALARDERFSPNSVDKDRAIIEAAATRLRRRGYSVRIINEKDFCGKDTADVILTMGRLRSTLDILRHKQAEGAVVINSPEGVAACSRTITDRIMRSNGIPVAPTEGTCGYWIKRGDEAAQSKDDVVFAADDKERDEALRAFKLRGVNETVVTAHVRGDVVKFYGVRGTDFFRTYYPADDGQTKFGQEEINGQPHHYEFSKDSLRHDADRTAALLGVDVYGGDCIVRADGTYAIIDFNDWPSFSRCREEAAEAIASIVCKQA